MTGRMKGHMNLSSYIGISGGFTIDTRGGLNASSINLTVFNRLKSIFKQEFEVFFYEEINLRSFSEIKH
jgi:hypothetical protein